LPETVINDAIAASSGGKVYIEAGTYTFTTLPIGGVGAIGTSSVSNVELYGAGSSTVLQAGTNLNGGIIYVQSGGGWYIHDLQINGNRASQSASGASTPYQTGIALYESSNDVIEHVYIHDEKTYGISSDAGSSNQILDNQVANSDANGIIMYGGSNHLVQGNVVNGASDVGISISGTNDNGNAPITNALCTQNTASNVNLDVSPFGQNSGVGIMVGDNGYATTITVSDNQISVASFGVSSDPYSGTNVDVTISGNTIQSTTVDGVYAEATTGITIENNLFIISAGADIYLASDVSGSVIENNVIEYTLTAKVVAGSGSVSPNCPSWCSEEAGSSISVAATPSTNWQFSSWSITGASCSGGSSSNPCTFTMPDNPVTVGATFVALITFATNPSDSGAVINWGSCEGAAYGNGQTLLSSSYGSIAVCYVPSGYTLSSWNCSGGLVCSGSNNPTLITFDGSGTITLNLKIGSLSNPVSTSLTASSSQSNPSPGTSFTVSGSLTANGNGVSGKTIVLVFGWSTNIATVTTQPDGTYTYTATAPSSAGSYNVDVFFLGNFTGTTQYLPSKATAKITVS